MLASRPPYKKEVVYKMSRCKTLPRLRAFSAAEPSPTTSHINEDEFSFILVT